MMGRASEFRRLMRLWFWGAVVDLAELQLGSIVSTEVGLTDADYEFLDEQGLRWPS